MPQSNKDKLKKTNKIENNYMEQSQLSVNERIRILLKNLDISQQVFAKSIRVSPQVVSLAIKGPNYPSFAFFKGVAEAYPYVNIRWLLLGEGSMFTNGDPQNFFSKQVELEVSGNIVQGSNNKQKVYSHKTPNDENLSNIVDLLKVEKDALIKENQLLKDLLKSKDQVIDMLLKK